MTVFDLQRGDSATISRINLSGSALSRLNALGINSGERIDVLSFSLFKSSVLISCAAVRVGIRRELAQKIEVRR